MEEIREHLRRAHRSLRAAETLLKEGLWEDCISRAYYAMFHAASALLLSKGLKPRGHQGVISLLGEHFVKAGLLSPDLGGALGRAMALRQKAEYIVTAKVSEEMAKRCLEEAKEFVGEAENLLSRLGQSSQ